MENDVFVRTKGKELAFLALYAYDVGEYPLNEIARFSWLSDMYAFDSEEGYLPKVLPTDKGMYRYGEIIARGALNELAVLDQEIHLFSKNRPFARLLPVDLSLLRIGAYLLIFDRDTPTEVILAVCGELADLYGEVETPTYVQGILGSIAEKWRTHSSPENSHAVVR